MTRLTSFDEHNFPFEGPNVADNLTHDEPFILHYLIQWLRSSDQNQNSDHLQSALHQPSPTWNYGGPHKMGRTAFLVQPAVF